MTQTPLIFTLKSTRLAAMLTALLVGAAACNDLPVTPTPTVTTTDIFFSSQLMAGGSVSRSFTTPKTGEAKILFTSLLPESSAVVTVSLGTFDGTTCSPTTSVAVAAGSTTPVITTTLNAGTYCIQVADTGALTKTNDFSMTLTIPAGS